MEVISYMANSHPVSSLLLDLLEDEGIKGTSTDCLCKVQYGLQNPKLKVALLHPHRNKECLERIKGIIESTPSVQFYIITVNAEERRGVIGEHSNVVYMDDWGFYHKNRDYYKEIRDIVKTRS